MVFSEAHRSRHMWLDAAVSTLSWNQLVLDGQATDSADPDASSSLCRNKYSVCFIPFLSQWTRVCVGHQSLLVLGFSDL